MRVKKLTYSLKQKLDKKNMNPDHYRIKGMTSTGEYILVNINTGKEVTMKG